MDPLHDEQSFQNGRRLGKAYSLTGVGSAGYGFVAWLCLIAVLLLLVRPVMKIVKKEEYWDF